MTMDDVYARNVMSYEEAMGIGLFPEMTERRVEDRLRDAGVPERFIGAEADERDLTHGRGVMLFGVQGSGKTTRAVGIMRGWMVGNAGDARFVTSADLLTEIGATYSTDSTELSVLRRYGRCGLLVIDDLGKENPTDNALTKLWQVIDTRYGAMLPTVITTQYDLAGLVRELGRRGGVETAKAIVSRLYETCQPVSTGNVDHRRQKKNR